KKNKKGSLKVGDNNNDHDEDSKQSVGATAASNPSSPRTPIVKSEENSASTVGGDTDLILQAFNKFADRITSQLSQFDARIVAMEKNNSPTNSQNNNNPAS